MKITIVLPLPRRVLLPNGSRGAHRMAVHTATSKSRGEAKYAALHAMQEQGKFFSEKPRLTIHYYGRTKMHPDPGNILRSIKTYEDGLADAGLFRNDRFMTYGDPVFFVDKANPRLEIVLEA